MSFEPPSRPTLEPKLGLEFYTRDQHLVSMHTSQQLSNTNWTQCSTYRVVRGQVWRSWG